MYFIIVHFLFWIAHLSRREKALTLNTVKMAVNIADNFAGEYFFTVL